jgi:tripartite-type tricarboxylate transporter receptor subunit TctC
MKLPRRTFLHLAAGAAVLPAVWRIASAQAYPTRPVRIIVGFAPGGATDITARLIGQWLSERLDQPFVIDNRPGANGNIGTEAVVRAPPDGYTLLLASSPNATNASLYDKLSFNFIRDIAPVAGIIVVPSIMVVHPSVPAKTIPEFVAYAKANPGKINFGSSGLATITHLFGEMLQLEAGIKMTHVPYRGSAPATNALVAGEVQVQFDQTCLPHVKAGKLVGLAMLSNVRHPDFPDVPTLREAGYRKEEGDSWFGILAPTGTSPAVIAKLEKAIADAVRAPDIIEKLHLGGCYVTYLNAPDFRSRITDESKMFGNIIQKGNIKLT